MQGYPQIKPNIFNQIIFLEVDFLLMVLTGTVKLLVCLAIRLIPIRAQII